MVVPGTVVVPGTEIVLGTVVSEVEPDSSEAEQGSAEPVELVAAALVVVRIEQLASGLSTACTEAAVALAAVEPVGLVSPVQTEQSA